MNSVRWSLCFWVRDVQIAPAFSWKNWSPFNKLTCSFNLSFIVSFYIFLFPVMSPYIAKTFCKPCSLLAPRIMSGCSLITSSNSSFWTIPSSLSCLRGRKWIQKLSASLGSKTDAWDFIILPIEATPLSLQWPYVFYFSDPFGILTALYKA